MENSKLPLGTIVASMLTTDSIPEGWLPCDASAIPAQYQELMTLLGNSKTPNLGGRTLIGAGTPCNCKQDDGFKPNFPDGTTFTLSKRGGEYQHTLITAETPSHNHNIGYQFQLSSGCHEGDGSTPCLGNGDNALNTTNTVGSDQPHYNMQPYFVVNYIIYAVAS